MIIKCNTTRGASLLYNSDYGNHVVYCNDVCIIILMYPDSSPFNVSTTQKCKKGVESDYTRLVFIMLFHSRTNGK